MRRPPKSSRRWPARRTTTTSSATCGSLLGKRSNSIELDPPTSRYWSVHLNNWWLESPEFRDGQSVCINDTQAERLPDGRVKILVGPVDPGSGNWLDTKGRTETILLARYLVPEGGLAPIATRLVTT